MARTEGVLNNGEILTLEELDQVANNSMLFKDNNGSYIALPLGVAGTVPTSNGINSAPTMQSGGIGDALTTDPLSQFAPTTSAEFAGVISDETGTGQVVLGTSPNITTPTGIVKTDVGLSNVDNTSDATKDSAVATLTNKTLTAPVIDTTANITDSLDKRFVTDVNLTTIGNTSGTNTGDETDTTIKTKYENNLDTNAFTDNEKTVLSTQSGTNTGDQTTFAGISDTLANLNTSISDANIDEIATKKSNLTAIVAPTVTDDSALGYAVGSAWIDVTADKAYVCLDSTVGVAVWTETSYQTTITGNAGTATSLETARTVNGVAFDGTANITVPSDVVPGVSGNVLTSDGTVWTSNAPAGGGGGANSNFIISSLTVPNGGTVTQTFTHNLGYIPDVNLIITQYEGTYDRMSYGSRTGTSENCMFIRGGGVTGTLANVGRLVGSSDSLGVVVNVSSVSTTSITLTFISDSATYMYIYGICTLLNI